MKITIQASVAITILVGYIILTVIAVIDVINGGSSILFNVEMEQVLAIICGLVSAVVIAEFAVKGTENDTKFAFRTFGALKDTEANGQPDKYIELLSKCYVYSWLAMGLISLIIGLVQPNEATVLKSVGMEWLGLAVASTYAFFGLDPG